MKTKARVPFGQGLCAKQRHESQRLYRNSSIAQVRTLLKGITPLLANHVHQICLCSSSEGAGAQLSAAPSSIV